MQRFPIVRAIRAHSHIAIFNALSDEGYVTIRRNLNFNQILNAMPKPMLERVHQRLITVYSTPSWFYQLRKKWL